jgi:hypothetical protein
MELERELIDFAQNLQPLLHQLILADLAAPFIFAGLGILINVWPGHHFIGPRNGNLLAR